MNARIGAWAFGSVLYFQWAGNHFYYYTQSKPLPYLLALGFGVLIACLPETKNLYALLKKLIISYIVTMLTIINFAPALAGIYSLFLYDLTIRTNFFLIPSLLLVPAFLYGLQGMLLNYKTRLHPWKIPC